MLFFHVYRSTQNVKIVFTFTSVYVYLEKIPAKKRKYYLCIVMSSIDPKKDVLGEMKINKLANQHSFASSKNSHPATRSKKETDKGTLETYKYDMIDFRRSYTTIETKLKDFESYVEVNDSFIQLYRYLIWKHQLKKLEDLTKKHMVWIIALLDSGKLTQARSQILSLLNENNVLTVQTIEQVLLVDFTSSNQNYLSTLKILTMQLILKTKSSERYASLILECFLNDTRYLIKDPGIKIHTVVKLLLNFFTQLPDYKPLFALKFLQYVYQFGLEFDLYIKNISIASFQLQIPKFLTKSKADDCLLYFPKYYADFRDKSQNEDLKVNEFLDKASYEYEVAFSNLSIQLKKKECNPQDVKCFLSWLLSRSSIDKNAARLCDELILILNSSVVVMEKASMMNILRTLSDIFYNSKDFKRYDNVTTVLFNTFVIKKDSEYLILASELNFKLFSVSNNLDRLISKMAKFLKSCPLVDVQRKIFSQSCNVFYFSQERSFKYLWEFTKIIVAPCFKNLKIKTFESFDFVSEPMLCLLYSSSSFVPTFSWSPLCLMLDGILRNQMNFSPDIDTRVHHLEALSNHEILIKSIYCFNSEIQKGSISNFPNICQVYIEKWLKKGLTKEADGISYLEATFIKELAHQLHFNKMFKMLEQLCVELKNTGRYEILKDEVTFWLLMSHIGLEMVGKVDKEISSIDSAICINNKIWADMPIEKIYYKISFWVEILNWKSDYNSFNDHLIRKLLLLKPELFDIQNKGKHATADYLKILILNVKLTRCASQLQFKENNLSESLKECKKSIKLCQLLIRQQGILPVCLKSEIISILNDLFQRIIKIYQYAGIFKDCSFYVNEYQRVIGSLRDPTSLFDMYCHLHEHYILEDDLSTANMNLLEMNKAFSQLDDSSNIDALAKFLYYNKEYAKLKSSFALFFDLEVENSCIPTYWKLKMGHEVENTFGRNIFVAMNNINRANSLYRGVLKQMECDSFFRSIGDSAMAIPCCHQNNCIKTANKSSFLNTNISESPLSSPRPSSLTPRGKIRHRFDSTTAINKLQMLNRHLSSVDTTFLRVHEIRDLSALHSISISLLFSMSTRSNASENLRQNFRLQELPRTISLYYEKIFSGMGNEIYEKFVPGKIEPKQSKAHVFQEQINHTFESFSDKWSKFSFNVFHIDVCSYTGNLLVTKLDSKGERPLHLRLPLNRHNSRDLSEDVLTFDNALKKINEIIESNNKSTSLEVTSSITTQEERKKWWDQRYELDRKLQRLLNVIEDSWFCGFKGVFSPVLVDNQRLIKFKQEFQSILHSYLPSRKNHSQMDAFLQIEDSLIELFLYPDILVQPTEKTLAMMEDLIYFIFDVLLFHGEQNAYDEIDINLIHVKLEELLQEYTDCEETPKEKVEHTFLILGNKCHTFPWESLVLFNGMSVSRVTSLMSLDALLTKFDNICPAIDVSERLGLILNPGNDLGRSEVTFDTKFKILAENPKSHLFTGNAPAPSDFLQLLENVNLFIYVGHSGGEQYVKIKDLRKSTILAPSILLGCSSAHLNYRGHFESTGTVYAYLLGGSPMVVGNLWDVTDKDIDKLSYSMFEKTGLFGDSEKTYNVCHAMAFSREQCKMRYLNGAAMIAYGLPIKFTKKLT